MFIKYFLVCKKKPVDFDEKKKPVDVYDIKRNYAQK